LRSLRLIGSDTPLKPQLIPANTARYHNQAEFFGTLQDVCALDISGERNVVGSLEDLAAVYG